MNDQTIEPKEDEVDENGLDYLVAQTLLEIGTSVIDLSKVSYLVEHDPKSFIAVIDGERLVVGYDETYKDLEDVKTALHFARVAAARIRNGQYSDIEY